jgi:metal-responsive CopG/Arc/MetJ family transcriptional regulator
MKTISLTLPDRLHAKLERIAKERDVNKAELVRAALEDFVNGERKSETGSLLERAGDLIGCLEGPGDLSTNPKYMEGFGE